MQPGDRVMLRAMTLWRMGLGVAAGEFGVRVWTVVACGCDLCGLGRHVQLDDGRHVAAVALRVEGDCVDELDARTSDAASAGIGRGMRRGRIKPQVKVT